LNCSGNNWSLRNNQFPLGQKGFEQSVAFLFPIHI
jgi:hypothetical protein